MKKQHKSISHTQKLNKYPEPYFMCQLLKVRLEDCAILKQDLLINLRCLSLDIRSGSQSCQYFISVG